eukprot:gene11326-10969_t
MADQNCGDFSPAYCPCWQARLPQAWNADTLPVRTNAASQIYRESVEQNVDARCDEKMKMCTSYTCVPLETPRQLSREIVSAGAEEEQPVADEGVDDDDGGDDDDDGEFVRAENIYDRPAAGKGDRSTHQFYLLGYVITETCTADFDVDACYGPPGSRWWDE